MNFLREVWTMLKKTDDQVSALIASRTVRVLEIELLLFPVLVVLFASAALACGGRCALWQWWAAMVVAVVVGWFYSGHKRQFLFGSFLFMAALLFLWVACGITVVPLGDDHIRYHLTGIRLLAEGWNPIWQGNWEQISAAFGIDQSETKPFFVLSTAKGIWYLDAVAYQFVRNPFNLMTPAYLLLGLTSLVTVFRNFSRTSVFVRIALALIMIRIVPSCGGSIDAIVGFSGICLLTAMYRFMVHNEWDWYQLLCYSFWMCIAKQTGAFHCAIFWAVLSIVVLARIRWQGVRRLTIVAILMAFSFFLVGLAPYLSAWMNFGHPLYPKYTADAENYPVHDIVTCDFLLRNDDAASMGHLGAYVRAYVSTTLADKYYNCKLGRQDFSPNGVTWSFGDGYPTHRFRFAFFSSVLLLLFLGKKEDAVIAIMLLAASLSMPTEMIGYARYCPWMLGGVLFVVPLLTHGRMRYLRWLMFLVFAYLFCVPFLCELPGDCGCKIAYAQAGMEFLRKTPPLVIFNGHTENVFATRSQEYFDIFFSEKGTSKRGDDVNKTSLGNLKLLQRQVSSLAKSEIVDFTTGGAKADRFRASNGKWAPFYDNSFKVAPEEPLPKLCGPVEVPVVLSKLVLRRLTGRFCWD